MTDWATLLDHDFNELLRLSQQYDREAQRCRDSKAYLGGCVLASASLEAILIAMVHLYSDEVESAGRVARVNGRPKHLLQWTLAELLNAADGTGWLPSGLIKGTRWNTRRAKIGDYAQTLREIRNLIHPGRYLQDHSPSRVTSRYLERSLEIVSVAASYLEAKMHDSLKGSMESEA